MDTDIDIKDNVRLKDTNLVECNIESHHGSPWPRRSGLKFEYLDYDAKPGDIMTNCSQVTID